MRHSISLTSVPATFRLMTGAVIWLACIAPASANAALSLGAGTIDCSVDVSSAGYSDQQLHHWEVSAGTRLTPNMLQVLAGTWTVRGQGGFTRSQGSQTLTASWLTQAAAPAPMAVLWRADGTLLLKSWHAQLRVRNGIQGQQQLTIAGQAQRPVAIGLEAFEWPLPVMQTRLGNAELDGNVTGETTGSTAPMQPGSARGIVRCSWKFGVLDV
jgi:hypothetical protein